MMRLRKRIRPVWQLIVMLVLLSAVSYGFADTGDVTDDFQGFFMWPNATCPGYAMAVWADVDGIDNGTVYDPYETMVTFYTVSGQAYGTLVSGEKTYFFSPHDTECVPPGESCTIDDSCDRSRFVINFVDMTAPGFDQTDWPTWVFKTVPSLSFEMSNDGAIVGGVADPYQQAKAYKVVSGIYGDPTAMPDPANLIDVDATCETPAHDLRTCEFTDADDGIREIWVTTDYAENNLDEFIIRSPTAPGVVLLFDGSGSMSWRHDGARGRPEEEWRISLAKRAALPFMDELLDHGENQVQFGIARFPRDPYDGCNAETVTDMTLVTPDSHSTATGTTIPGLAPGGATPMIAGLQQAAAMLGAQEPKAIVLLSDGYHNCPSLVEAGDEAYTDLVAGLAGIRVYTIGFSRPGDVDGHFLDELATATVGQFSDVTESPFDPDTWDPATALAGTYHKILADGLGLPVLADPMGVIAATDTTTHEVAINEHDRRVSFFLSWATPQQGRLGLTVRSSDNLPVTIAYDGVRTHEGSSYKIITVDKTFLRQSGKVGPVPWTIEIDTSGMSAGEEHYQYSVIADSTLKMRASLDRPRYETGNVVTIATRVFEAGPPLTGLESVQVKITRPSDGGGNWFAANKVSAKELASIPANLSNENFPPVQRKAMFLTEMRQVTYPGRRGPVTLELYDDGTHGDAKAGDGIYTNQFSDTVKEGTYSFYVRASGSTRAGNKFKRERLIQKYITVNVAPEYVLVDVDSLGVTADEVQRYAVTVTPKDPLGNYLGPRYSAVISMTASKGTFVGGLKDNLDGTYTQILNLPAGVNVRDVDITISVKDEELTFNLAEKVGRRYGISFHLGGAIPTGNFNNNYDAGYSVGLNVEYRLLPQLLVQGIIGYNHFDAGSSSVSDTCWWNISANLKYEITTTPLRPYIHGGPGIYIPKSGSTEPGYNIGLGLDHSLSPDWTVGLGADYHHIFTSGSDTEFFVPHIGVIYRF